LPVANRRKRLGGGLKGGLATIERGAARRREPPSLRVPSTVLDRARRARVGAAAGAMAVARLEERRATRGCAGQATRALAAIMLLTSSAFSASGRACRVAGRDDGKSVARVHERDTRRVLPEATRRGRGGARRSVPPEANACEISPPLSLGSTKKGAFLKTWADFY